MRIRFINEYCLYVRNISMYRNMVIGKITVDVSAVPVINHAFFHERHTNTTNNSTYDSTL